MVGINNFFKKTREIWIEYGNKRDRRIKTNGNLNIVDVYTDILEELKQGYTKKEIIEHIKEHGSMDVKIIINDFCYKFDIIDPLTRKKPSFITNSNRKWE